MSMRFQVCVRAPAGNSQVLCWTNDVEIAHDVACSLSLNWKWGCKGYKVYVWDSEKQLEFKTWKVSDGYWIKYGPWWDRRNHEVPSVFGNACRMESKADGS